MQTSLEVCNLLVLCLPGLPDHLSPGAMQQTSLKAGLSDIIDTIGHIGAAATRKIA